MEAIVCLFLKMDEQDIGIFVGIEDAHGSERG